MSWWLVLFTLTIWIVASSTLEEERKIHRLIGGHLRIFHEDPHDAELLEASASGSKGKKSNKGDDEEKKTLSQQVADGKYGLIQKELFKKPSKPFGLISYDNNPEVPKDNINNLGGLTKSDIWLAENHLLVLRGGTYPPHENKNDNPWPPIDDYKAPLRQVKIPAHPKVPPPFPVQLTDDGPLQILGTNSSRTINGTIEEAAFAVPPPEGYEPPNPYLPPPGYPYPANATAGQAPYPIPPYPPGEYPPGSPFPPYNLNGTLPPFFASLPPGAAILPPPLNQTDFDEDDPSIYYPPPYSFYYPKDNSSLVPAGPLVPGIVLPPPPNFFGPLEEKTTTTTRRPTRPTRPRVPTTTTPLPQIHPTTTAVPPTSVLNERKPVRILPVHTPSEINNELKPIVTTKPPPKVVTVISVRPKVTKNRTRRPPTVTVLKPVKQPPSEVYIYKQPQRVKTVVSSTQVPLKVYYSTSNDIDSNSITHSPRRVKTTTKQPTQYYYYEEQRPREVSQDYYSPPQQQKYVYVPTQRPRFRLVQTPKTDTFSIHIAKLQKQIHQYYTTSRPTHRPKPVYQFSFEAANYRQPDDPQDKFRPLPKYSVQIQPAIEIIPTQAPPPTYYQVTTERPPPSKYYDDRKPYYDNRKPDYDDRKPDYDDYGDYGRYRPTQRPINQYAYEVTPNPVNQGYYTKPDEGYFDDNTKQYFSTFGQRIPTTPIPRRKQKPINLEGDTAVNYLPPRPTINPNAEFVPINPNYPQYTPQESRQKLRRPEAANPDQGSSFISYQLPGDDGAHFYFLTPQLAQSRDQGAGYYYNSPRIRRNKER